MPQTFSLANSLGRGWAFWPKGLTGMFGCQIHGQHFWREKMMDTHCNNRVAILPLNPHIVQQEINDFIHDFLQRFQCHSAESFAELYEDQARARELFETYYELITGALGMAGAPGYERPAPTEQEIWQQTHRQRQLRADLLALDESNFTENSA